MTSTETCDIKNIIRDIESSKHSPRSIMDKYNLTSYKYYKLLKEAEIKNLYPKKGPIGVLKNTPFKKLLNQSDEHDESAFDLEAFKKDCQNLMKLSELMDKYHLSLYQVRELRKKYDLKTK